MPRDDLSIDMTKNMRLPVAEQMDASAVLEEWTLRANNLPGEAQFAYTEIEVKDREMAECKATIEELDAKIQKYIKTHGSSHPNPKEAAWRATIREKFDRCEVLTEEKLDITNNLMKNFDKHLRSLDHQIKSLYDRNEPGFDDPDELPSLVRASAANTESRQTSIAPSRPHGQASRASSIAGPSAPATAVSGAGATGAAATGPPPLTPVLQVITQGINRTSAAQNSQIRMTQGQHNYPSSAPATPAASMIMMGRHQRESSAGPAVGSIPKRVQRQNSVVGSTLPANPSGLARQASIGPGTPKAGSGAISASQPTRAGSIGPKSAGGPSSRVGGSRKGTPSASIRKKPPTSKSSLSRVKGARTKKSPGSAADSEMSDAESGSGEEEVAPRGTARLGGDGHMPRRLGHMGHARRDTDGDVDMDDEEAGDDKKYCLCQNVSFGDMVACDMDDCPYEWFHWSCVGLKGEPSGKWYCPSCLDKINKGKKLK